MIRVGLIGYGKWGKILYRKLEKFCDVRFTCRSKDTYIDKLHDVDWVIVSTPNHTHFDIVEQCIISGKNVFCEKPLTPTYEKSKKLFELANNNNVKLYVDDVQNFRKINYSIMEHNSVEWKKKDNFNHSYYMTKDLLYRLAYHDIYYLYEHIKNSEIEDIKLINSNNKLQFHVCFNDINIHFCYDTNFDLEKTHHINGCDLMGDGSDDPLYDMLYKVLNDEVDFDYNKKISLFTNKFIDNLNEKLFKKVSVIGAGIFGCTIAWKLAKNGFDVSLYEKNDDIITQASYINQYRLHRGYHYPRSKETAQSSIWGESGFIKAYGEAIINGDIEHHYAIAKEDSKVSDVQYKEFLDDLDLNYVEKELDIMNKNSVDLVVKVDELLFNPDKLKSICWKKLKKYNVNVVLNTNYDVFDLDDSCVINATYANLNQILPLNKQKDYQFELCEKPVVKLPKKYKNKSVVVMDGPFMCIDPLGDTDYHVMGNVVHAIHHTTVGKFPKYDSKFDKLLNKGIVKNPSITNIDKFIDSAKHFFNDIDKAEHIGSMFTFRTVLPNRDKDDARPTLIEKSTDNIFNVFSGKIGTCVTAAEEILEYV
jgi:hypothetical protein